MVLAGCSEEKTDHANLAKYEAGKRDPADDLIDCAQRGTAFTRTCTVDRQTGDDGLVLTVRHLDGAFHRLLVTKDGRGVVAADGAEQAIVSVIGDGRIEIALGGDRYRLPATIKPKTP